MGSTVSGITALMARMFIRKILLDRSWSFNLTLFIAGAFGVAAGGSQDFLTLASLFAVLGTGVGGTVASCHFEGRI